MKLIRGGFLEPEHLSERPFFLKKKRKVFISFEEQFSNRRYDTTPDTRAE
jgi:hypothetical protein